MKKYLRATCGLLFIATCVHAQLIKPLKIGDKLPDSVLPHVLNYQKSSLALSDFRGKYILLDFFGTHCVPCIKALPHIQQMQEQFGDKLQCILVTTDDSTEIHGFLSKNAAPGFLSGIPVITGDSLLLQLVMHHFIPHLALVDQQGYLLAIPEPDSLTTEKMNLVLEKKPADLGFKNDDRYYDIDNTRPLFLNGNGGQAENIISYSVMTGMNKNVVPGFAIRFNEDNQLYSVTSLGTTIKFLYQEAFYDDSSFFTIDKRLPNSRTLLKVKDSSKLVPSVNKKIQEKNIYCYQLISKAKSSEDMRRLMKEDLKNKFGLHVHMVRTKKMCLVLTVEDTALISTGGGPELMAGETKTRWCLNWKNVPFIWFTRNLMYYYLFDSPYPFIDKTGFTGNVDWKLENLDKNDYRSFDRELSKYKMHLTLEPAYVDVLEISD